MARKHRMTRLLEIATIAPQRDFTGRACAETSWRMQSLANATAMGLCMTMADAHSECDPAPHPLHRWRTAKQHRPHHYFMDIMNQLKPKHQAELASRLPDYDKDDAEAILTAHNSIRDYFLGHNICLKDHSLFNNICFKSSE